MSFNSPKGVTEPGVTPKFFNRWSGFAKEIFPRLKHLDSFFNSTFVVSTQENR